MLKPWHLMDCFAALNITLPLSGASEWGQSLLALSDEVGRSGQYKHYVNWCIRTNDQSCVVVLFLSRTVLCHCWRWRVAHISAMQTYLLCTQTKCQAVCHSLEKNCWDSSSHAAATCIYLCQQRRRARGELRWNIVKCSARHKQTEQCEKSDCLRWSGCFSPFRHLAYCRLQSGNDGWRRKQFCLFVCLN